MAEQDIAVRVNELSKSFRIPLESSNGLKQKLINFIKGRKGHRVFTPLKDVSFTIEKGDFFGIVGRNGSGKSTLLKTIAGIYTPNKGQVTVNGTLVPFIELGVGFNPELTGRENVYLNGALLGFSNTEMNGMYEDIVAFAELGDFMDERLKNYSSGMQVRLAFSIAIQAKGDILLLDEVLAVGDEAFQKKCINYFYELKREKRTVILVTHDMSNIERFCNRALVIDRGKAVGVFSPEKAQHIYRQLNRNDESNANPYSIKKRWGTGAGKIEKLELNGKGVVSDKEMPRLGIGDELTISAQITSKDGPEELVFGIAIRGEDGSYIAGPNSQQQHFMSGNKITYNIAHLPLNPGVYSIEAALFNSEQEEYDHMLNAAKFEVVDTEGPVHYGQIDLFGEWSSR